jgi:hypothetical protein
MANNGVYRGTTPKITWGAAFANTITFAQPLDVANCYSGPPAGWEPQLIDAANGERDGWLHATFEFLEGVAKRIPRVDTGGITGWEGATGWDAFFAWARDANVFRFYPDATDTEYWEVLLWAPLEDGQHDEAISRHRELRFVMRMVAADTLFTGY